MEYSIAVDLKVARRRSGLSQADVAHLLAVDRSRVSKLEHGHYQPAAHELVGICLIYGKDLSRLCPSVIGEACKALNSQLATLPNQADKTNGLDNRSQALSNLAERLADPHNTAYEN